MSPVWVLLLLYFWAADPPRCFLCLYMYLIIILFYFIVLPLSSFCVFFHCVSHSLSLPLSSCLCCTPLLKGLPILRSLLTRMFFLLYAYYGVVFCLFLLLLLFSCVFVASCFFPYILSLLCPFLATMSFAGY